MLCPINSCRCSKYNTVRHCPGCPVWRQIKEARQDRAGEMQKTWELQGEAVLQAPQQEGTRGQAPWGQPPWGWPPQQERPGDQAPCGQALQPVRPRGQAPWGRPPQQEGSRIQARWGQPPQPGSAPQRRAHMPLDDRLAFAAAPEQNPGGQGGMKRLQEKRRPAALILEPKDVVYLYDGSLSGFFCCVYESVYLRELPAEILSMKEAQPTLLQTKEILPDREKSAKVRASIPKRISEDALDLVETVFLSCLKQRELRSLRFLLLGYREGSKALDMLGHPDVAPLLEAEKHVLKEAHLLKGFVRFSDYDGVLAANITPKNFILPFIANHFCARYAEENFIIYDKAHQAGLIYQDRVRSIVRLEEMPFPQAEAEEERYRALWKKFYHTIAIESRINPRCRMTHMPKRYWENMTEMRELL